MICPAAKIIGTFERKNLELLESWDDFVEISRSTEYNLVFSKYFILNNEDPYLEFQSFLKSDKAG